jgi:hypothetical protein
MARDPRVATLEGRITMRSNVILCILLLPALILLIAASTSGDHSNARAELLALHKASLQAHFDGNWRWFGENIGDDYVLGYDGEIHRATREATNEMFQEYFSVTSFDAYDDVTEPLIHVSEDGTLGTVLVRVHVSSITNRGEESESRAESTWVWINTWAKVDGRWLLQSNVSNMHEGPPATD